MKNQICSGLGVLVTGGIVERVFGLSTAGCAASDCSKSNISHLGLSGWERQFQNPWGLALGGWFGL